jgi:hypothetical protein
MKTLGNITRFAIAALALITVTSAFAHPGNCKGHTRRVPAGHRMDIGYLYVVNTTGDTENVIVNGICIATLPPGCFVEQARSNGWFNFQAQDLTTGLLGPVVPGEIAPGFFTDVDIIP